MNRAVIRYLSQQRSRILAASRDLDTLDVSQIFHIDDEDAALIGAISGLMPGLMLTGAQDGTGIRKLPRVIQDGVAREFQTIIRQPYWRDIQLATASAVASAVAIATAENETLAAARRQLAKALKQSIPARADGIATTETTLAYNSGRDVGHRHLAQAGVAEEKEWVAILDGVTRVTHADADGQRVEISEDYVVGGERTPYPGWWGLSAGERCNCRCVSVVVKKTK